ncbi:MAG: hypothetical protein SFW36_22140, partial [Leptolyngbyaceae cyanobacterium bins.59]|nr:hypothetical protein [Leptolyngbyaceae cyanobacterium bins.59]
LSREKRPLPLMSFQPPRPLRGPVMQNRHQPPSTQLPPQGLSEQAIDDLFGTPEPNPAPRQPTRLVRPRTVAPAPVSASPTPARTTQLPIPRPAPHQPQEPDYEAYEYREENPEGLPGIGVVLLPWANAFLVIAVGKVTMATLASGPGVVLALLLSPLCCPWILLSLLGLCQWRELRTPKTVVVTLLLGWAIALPFQPVFLAPLKGNIPDLTTPTTPFPRAK